MKKLLTIVVGLILASSLVAAQASKSPDVKKVKGQITFSQDVKVGAAVLKGGNYEVSSNGTALTFRKLKQDLTFHDEWNFDMKEKPVVVQCTTTALPAKSHATDVEMPVDGAGVAVLKTITLEGTTVKFTIGN